MVSTQSSLQSPDNIMEIHTLINECGNIYNATTSTTTV